MYKTAGICPPGTSTGQNSVNIQKTIESAISSVPGLEGSNVTVKVCVMSTNQGTVNSRVCLAHGLKSSMYCLSTVDLSQIFVIKRLYYKFHDLLFPF